MADEQNDEEETPVEFPASVTNDVPHFYVEDHNDPRCGNVTTVLGVSGRGVEKIR